MNPIFELSPNPDDPIPLVELKQELVIFVKDPPGPKSVRTVYDSYLTQCGDRFTAYKSTSPGWILQEWTGYSRKHFEQKLLPDLRLRTDWGYGFSDNKPTDSWLFMFHGFRPASEPDCASFYRFEFDWQVSPKFLRQFTETLAGLFPLLSAYAGYFIQWRPSTSYARLSLDRAFAYAMRYWGCDMVDVELTAQEMNHGYKCVNWLTVIGEPFRSQAPAVLEKAKLAAYDYFETPFATLFQAAAKPVLGDRNRLTDLEGYTRLAEALQPIQIQRHEAFGGDRWTEEATLAWLRRFTSSK